jgi:SSS family solute:Na+ symporter
MPTVDIALVSVFLVVLVIVGLWPGKIRGREAFLISDRRLNGIVSGFSIAASKTGAGLLVTYSTLVFTYGNAALWLFVGYVFGYTLFYCYARSVQEEGHKYGYYTMADFFQRRFGTATAIVIGIGCTVSLTGWIFTNLIAGGDLVAALTKLSPLAATILLAAPIAIYLVAGGFHSVIKTEVLQYFAMMVILVVIVVALGNLETSSSGTATKSMPGGQIFNFIFLGTLFPMGSAELWQRAYAARDRKGLLQGIAIASTTFIVLGLVLSFICLRLREVTVAGGTKIAAELGLVSGVAHAVGPVLTGLWIVAFMSAILSATDTFIFTTAASLVQDVLERAGIVRTERRIFALRVAILLLCVTGIIGAVAFKSVVTVTFFYAGITMSLGVVALFARLTSRLSGFTVSGALLAGLVASIVEGTTSGVTALTATVNAGVTALVAIIGWAISVRVKTDIPTPR